MVSQVQCRWEQAHGHPFFTPSCINILLCDLQKFLVTGFTFETIIFYSTFLQVPYFHGRLGILWKGLRKCFDQRCNCEERSGWVLWKSTVLCPLRLLKFKAAFWVTCRVRHKLMAYCWNYLGLQKINGNSSWKSAVWWNQLNRWVIFTLYSGQCWKTIFYGGFFV